MNFKSKKKNFTLIELIVVIAVIAILAAIILPNISDMTAKATVSAIKGNARNIQTASDMYSYDFGNKATLTQPEYGVPKQFDYDKLYPKYLRNNCKDIKENYWVDNNGIVQGSVIKPPKVNELSGTSLSWENSLNAVSYNVYKDVNGKQVLFKENAVSPTTVDAGGLYFVSAVDRYNFETPAVSSKYDPSNDLKNCTSSGTGDQDPISDDTGKNSIFKIGDYIVLGEYNGQPLEWVVLKNDSSGIYVFNTVTINEMQERKFSENASVDNWEDSDIREFLNNEFYNTAFNTYQKSIINSKNYKSYVSNPSKADGGNTLLQYYYDDYEKILTSNKNTAYYENTTDKIALPSITDIYNTNIFLYILNIEINSGMYKEVFTRDSAYSAGAIRTLTKDMYGNVDSSAKKVNDEVIVRPVMYIKHDAVPTSGHGTIQSPYLFEQSYTSQPHRILVKEYEEIVVTNDMFPSHIIEDKYEIGEYEYIKTIKLEIPEEYEEDTLLLSMTLEKTHEGAFMLYPIKYDDDREDYVFWDRLFLTDTFSDIKHIRRENNMEITNKSIGTFKLYYEEYVDYKELDILIGRISNNTHGFKLTDIKLEKLIYN